MNPTPFLYYAKKAIEDASKGILSVYQLTKAQDTIMWCSVTDAIAGVGWVASLVCPFFHFWIWND